MQGSFIFYLLGIVDVSILFYNLGQTFKWLTCTETNTPYILERRGYYSKGSAGGTAIEARPIISSLLGNYLSWGCL